MQCGYRAREHNLQCSFLCVNFKFFQFSTSTHRLGRYIFRRLERALVLQLCDWLGGRFKFEFLSVKCVLLSDTHCENVNKLFVVIKRVINMEVAQKERLSFFEVRITSIFLHLINFIQFYYILFFRLKELLQMRNVGERRLQKKQPKRLQRSCS